MLSVISARLFETSPKINSTTNAEKIAINLAKIMDLFLIGTASKYRSVKAESLAKTMVLKADNKSGVNYFYFDDFLR